MLPLFQDNKLTSGASSSVSSSNITVVRSAKAPTSPRLNETAIAAAAATTSHHSAPTPRAASSSGGGSDVSCDVSSSSELTQQGSPRRMSLVTLVAVVLFIFVAVFKSTPFCCKIVLQWVGLLHVVFSICLHVVFLLVFSDGLGGILKKLSLEGYKPIFEEQEVCTPDTCKDVFRVLISAVE